MTHLFHLPVGDPSGDGHGRCDWFVCQAAKPLPEVEAAYQKIPGVLGVDIRWIFSEYGDNTLDEDQLRQIRRFLPPSKEGWEDLPDEEAAEEWSDWFNERRWANVVIKMINEIFEGNMVPMTLEGLEKGMKELTR